VFRQRDTGNDARVYALTFALLVASAAYRPGALFGVAFVAYMAAATVSLMVGHLLHSIERRPIADVPLRGGFLLQSAAFSGVALLTSAVVFLAFPRVTRGWVSRGLPLAQSVMGFSDRVSLLDHGGRLYPNPELVLRVEFPDSVPANLSGLHWRGLSFDRFTGTEWLRTPGLFQPPYRDTVPTRHRMIRQHIYGADLPDVSVLFGLHRVMRVDGEDFRLNAHRQLNGDYNYSGAGPPLYTVYSNVATPSEAELAADSGYATRLVGSYLQLPRLDQRIFDLADSLAAGAVTTADKVRAVQDYLRPFTYTIVLPGSAREATLEAFLFERRQGHCEYFSTAMAVLLRAMNVPTRNVNGFLGGEWNDFGKFLNVTQNQAHSWVEVWFPRYGWVEFDPTPASLSGLAEQNTPRFRNLRAFVDGLDYRWNRWVLEYDMKKQVNMFSKVADAFRTEPGTSGGTTKSSPLRWIMLGGVAILAFGIMRRRQSIAQKVVAPKESAAYLRMRRAYERRGYPAATSMPPLAFAHHIESARAPGAPDAMRAISLYVRARFNGEVLSDSEREELREAVASARAALRTSRNGVSH
jgi:transglutaminase-like putative cysteine protease